jgi:L-2-hydroxyglutarate oxidase
MDQSFDLIVVGGGIVGLATAYKYQKHYPSHSVAILEKESDLGAHQTGRNSGVIHSGIYYKPGSFKALNCTNGRKQIVAFAKEHNIPHDICGKIIIATEQKELPILKSIFEKGLANEIEGIEMIGPDAIHAIEPNTKGLQAIRVPVTGIIDYVAVCRKLVELIEATNPKSKLFLNTTFLESFSDAGKEGIKTNNGIFYCNTKIFCAGLQSDRLARKEGANPDMKIVGFRGDYYELTEKARHKVKHLIYPVPDPDFPFLGVHFTRMVDGSVECGPNAVFSFKREGYSATSFSWKDTVESLSYAGTWKLFGKHARQGMEEMKRAFSKRLFLQALRKMIPDLQMEDIQPVRAGVRAQALQANGDLVDDFKIEKFGNSVHVLNAPSPAATASLAIADEILSKAGLVPKI